MVSTDDRAEQNLMNGRKEEDPKRGMPANQSEDDLDDLDDLLDEFADDILSKQPGSGLQNEANITKGVVGDGSSAESTTNIDELIKDLKIEDPETKKQFEELVQQFSTEGNKDSSESTPLNFDNVMKETMERLKKSGQNIDEQLKKGTPGNPEDMLAQLLTGLNSSGDGAGDLNMSSLLADMLEQLSSKEVLYEPINDLNSKLPQYLEEKKGIIQEEQHQNYTQQYELTSQILAIFNAPDYSDEDKTKRERINVLLEALQELGQPPSEIVGNTDDFLGLGGTNAGINDIDFDDKDLPKDFEKELEENCKQT